MGTARGLLGIPLWAHEWLFRAEGTPVVDPDLILGLALGQAAYIYRGGVTYVQVKRPVAAPAELPGPPPKLPPGSASRPIPGRADGAHLGYDGRRGAGRWPPGKDVAVQMVA